MKSVNRAAVFVIPKKPYCEWASSVADHTPFTTEHVEGTSFLLPEYDDDEEVEELLRGCYSQIFEFELTGWDTRESVWPQNRSFETFLEWFDVIVTSMVLDLNEDMPLLQEEDD